ncbi:MAG: hypothetical protein IJQ79_05365 [Bacteroidales bacterium]|nr:hypothetical protein [Bacteroidales bacterium]
MKKYLLIIIAMLAICSVCFAQNTQCGKEKSYYLEVYEISMMTARSVCINWGINTPNPMTQTFKIFNQNGEMIKFDNVIGAINYLATFGWKLVSVYEREYKSSRTTYYLLYLDGNKYSHKRMTDEIDKAMANLQSVTVNN